MGSIIKPANSTQNYEKKMEKRIEKARFWEASRAGGWYYSVTHGSNAFIVKLTKRSCSCKSWDLSGLPCSHAIDVMREERLNPMTFTHDCYSTEYLRITYSHTLKLINVEDTWEKGLGEVSNKSPCERTLKYKFNLNKIKTP